MTKLDSILKSRDITLSTKVCLVKAMVFPVVMYGCESWTIKKAEHWRTDAFELWCWRRLLRVPFTERRWNQSILKEIHPEYSLEGLMRKLKLEYFGHLMRKADSLEKTLMLGKIKGRRKRGWQTVGWHHRLNGHEFDQLWEMVKDRETWCAAVHRVAKCRTWLSNWIRTMSYYVHHRAVLMTAHSMESISWAKYLLFTNQLLDTFSHPHPCLLGQKRPPPYSGHRCAYCWWKHSLPLPPHVCVYLFVHLS